MESAEREAFDLLLKHLESSANLKRQLAESCAIMSTPDNRNRALYYDGEAQGIRYAMTQVRALLDIIRI